LPFAAFLGNLVSHFWGQATNQWAALSNLKQLHEDVMKQESKHADFVKPQAKPVPQPQMKTSPSPRGASFGLPRTQFFMAKIAMDLMALAMMALMVLMGLM
jgi:hypothetical protein